jgi:hypothetical protein
MSTTKLQRTTGLVTAFSVFGAVLTPLVASAATSSANTTVNANIGSSISVATSGSVTINLTPTAGGVVTSANDTVSVSTNNGLGYTLSLADSDATTTLVSGANSIAAHAGTQTTPTALATNTWGYRVVGTGGFTGTAYSAETNNTTSASTWAGVPASGAGNTLKTTASTAAADTTTVWYGVKVDSSKPNGTYTDQVTYTAVTN